MYVIVERKCLSVQVPCATLHDVVAFLVEKTEGVLVPLTVEEAYEKSICTCGTAWPTWDQNSCNTFLSPFSVCLV